MISFEKFLDMVNYIYHESEFELRYGQTIMNLLYQVWPEKYKQITHSEYDCFYNDDIVELTLQKLRNEWITN